MHINFTNHAQLRIEERKISLIHIEKTLKDSDTTNSFSETYTSRKRFGNKTLEIVYKKKGKEIIIITAYYL